MAAANGFGSFENTNHCSRDGMFPCRFRFKEHPGQIGEGDWIGICPIGWRSPEKDAVQKCSLRGVEILDGYLVTLMLPSAPLADGDYQYVYVSGRNGKPLAVSEHRIVGSGLLSMTSSLSTNQSADVTEPRAVDGPVDEKRWEIVQRIARKFEGKKETDDLGRLKEDVMFLYEFVSEMQFKMLRDIQRIEDERDREGLLRQELDEREEEVAQLREQIRHLSAENEQLKLDQKKEKDTLLRLQEENDQVRKYGFVYKNYVDDQNKVQSSNNTGSTLMSTGEPQLPCHSSDSIHPEANPVQQMNRVPLLIFKPENSAEQGHTDLPLQIHTQLSSDDVSSNSKLLPSQENRDFRENYRSEFDDRRRDIPVSVSHTENSHYHSPVHIKQAPQHLPLVQTSIQASYCSMEEEVPQAASGVLQSQPYTVSRSSRDLDDLVYVCPVCTARFLKTAVDENSFARHVDSHFSD